ncbi:hypothetical protein GCM10009647_035770 [Streptomyces sanglieri]
MQDMVGVNCGCGENDHQSGETGSQRTNFANQRVCDHCEMPLEWRLRLDGVTELECPECFS